MLDSRREGKVELFALVIIQAQDIAFAFGYISSACYYTLKRFCSRRTLATHESAAC